VHFKCGLRRNLPADERAAQMLHLALLCPAIAAALPGLADSGG